MATKKRSSDAPAPKGDIEKTMHKFKEGTLRSSSGAKVTNRKQAIAIGLSEARADDEQVAPKIKSEKKATNATAR